VSWLGETGAIALLFLGIEWGLIWQQFYRAQQADSAITHPGVPEYGLWIRSLAVLGLSAVLWKISADLTASLGRAWAIGTIAPFFARKDRSVL